MITIAVPKGRLQHNIAEHFSVRGIRCHFTGRQLISKDNAHTIRWILVKNSDVPTYVATGIAALGIVGSDILGEHTHHLFRHFAFPFGKAKMCLINRQEETHNTLHNGVQVASKYTTAARNYLIKMGIAGSIYPLNGSLELAPLLGLAPFIIDIVQTGTTLASNNLKICTEIASTEICLISNPAYYKIYYKTVDTLIRAMQ